MPEIESGPTLAEIRAGLAVDTLTAAERELLVDQALIIVEDLFVHLAQKRAMYGVDPVQRLRLLRDRAARLPDAEFHAELQLIFDDLQDGHTQYSLPLAVFGRLVSLGFLLERSWDGEQERWIASHVNPKLAGRKLVTGAEITHWNGMPIAVAVARNAEREWGCNPPARLARGVESMTQRILMFSPVPDEDWVELGFLIDGKAHQTRIHWREVEAGAWAGDDDEGPPAAFAMIPGRLIGLDRRTSLIQRAKRALFADAGREVSAEAIETSLPGLRARRVTTPSGTFGHLRIFTFMLFELIYEPDRYWSAMVDLLKRLPRDGLILDVRGNGGGLILAAESLLQLFTPRRIGGEPFQFANTSNTAGLSREAGLGFTGWSGSIEESRRTGAQYSRAIPLNTDAALNGVGQRYHGPVLLVTDALCYSATDMLAAGFQDHGIGPVLGVDDNTGAGGAAVLQHFELQARWPGSPLEPLPHRTGMSVALLRSLRVGQRAGQPLEDLGVVPDERHRITRRDLLEHNVDLMARAGELLAGRPARRLDMTVKRHNGGSRLRLTTKGLTSVDVYVDGRPVAMSPVGDGENLVHVPVPEPGKVTIRVEGFDGENLVAARSRTPDS